MFTGIIETFGQIQIIEKKQGNVNLTIKSNFTNELKIDQSVAHNGICLTVVMIEHDSYVVTAIEETINKTTIGMWKQGEFLNLERGMKLSDRLDGHIVQGHVDGVAECVGIVENKGSWIFTFRYSNDLDYVTIEKGSITINGVSLTVVNSKVNEFSVAIIPYTFENTCFKYLKINDKVNLEFDVIGKYVTRLFKSK